ncbi:NADH-quinone oxidoreductase subunit NuoN [Brevibacillus halotolerans]|uniref:NADH-quinone oxidoreductase subunit NuoN n=1 Tax=Brevibacillus TaxID=55080 RepID=UPI00215C0092|nr:MULTISPECIES: NADH-quinone oxidoreductase subunit NuoN [Brevibacillus]MCR8963069.1 NADH-quinone oxidoreductase subunit NuoN [Brevibacillus laterosporus]MCZ0835225.1 NADH-quinone oxidoreductase subunit NuoN [Brevibacillus halotolerans]
MDVKDIFSYNWSYLLPEFTILGFATVLSIVDLIAGKRLNRTIMGWLSLLGVLIAGYFIVSNVTSLKEPVIYMADMMRVDHFGSAFKLILLAGVAFALLMSISYIKKTDEVVHSGEFYYLMLMGLVGCMVMASSADLITLFVGLELLSLASYIMVGMRKKRTDSNEAAFKYVVAGGIATAVTLFGMSYLYGFSGTTNLYEMTQRLSEAYQSGFGSMILIGFVFLVAGLTYKISAVPNHMWAPDVYQGAATPVTAFLAVVSKGAGFALLIRVMILSFAGLFNQETNQSVFGGMLWLLSIVAGLSMIVGNTLALRQKNVKRLMAYSGIAQAGYLLVPLVILHQTFFFEQIIFYLVAYLMMAFGAFALIMVVTEDRKTQDIKAFAGLYHRSPLAAVAMTLFLLSLAGIPISAGFFGKFYIFLSAIGSGSFWLAGIMLATSVVSYYYYFGIIRQMYMRAGETEETLRLPIGVTIIVVLAALGTFVFGLVPEVLIQYIHTHFNPMFNWGDML